MSVMKGRFAVMAGAVLLAFLARTPEEISKIGAAGLFPGQAQAAEASAAFKWYPARPGITRAQIALGRAVTLPFEFILKENVVRVSLSIPKKFVDIGIDIGDDVVAVKAGKASSTVLFAVPPGKPLGKFDLEITAKDAATGREIGKGKIPFMLLPPGVGGC